MSRLPLYSALTGTVLIGLGAFWLSFTALQDLAAQAKLGSSQSFVWPLVVDLTIVVATLAVVVMERGRWYAWLLLALAAGISLVGNAAHAWETGPIAVGVATVPPLFLLMLTHLCVKLTADRSQGEVVELEIVDDASFRPARIAG
ncbi:DUF2637 domain-containing protein [Rhodococcoides kyotonense]|uniref:Excisionase n=1 Tax=Rhodococcoides kyotonense TaxID=398843 RepID=A0A239FKF6_9NOCA|nr:DUF2637 domain-containing protein [Rhodococcus kyotonensis]SNS57386.1 Protein of unknown function [Rhodococcus kyotonensis]